MNAMLIPEINNFSQMGNTNDETSKVNGSFARSVLQTQRKDTTTACDDQTMSPAEISRQRPHHKVPKEAPKRH